MNTLACTALLAARARAFIDADSMPHTVLSRSTYIQPRAHPRVRAVDAEGWLLQSARGVDISIVIKQPVHSILLISPCSFRCPELLLHSLPLYWAHMYAFSKVDGGLVALSGLAGAI